MLQNQGISFCFLTRTAKRIYDKSITIIALFSWPYLITPGPNFTECVSLQKKVPDRRQRVGLEAGECWRI